MEALLILAGVHLLAILSPGPDVVLISRQSLLYGWQTGWWTTLGILVGVGAQGAAVISGLTLALHYIPRWEIGLGLLGGSFMSWLAWQSWPRTTPQAATEDEVTKAPTQPRVLQAFATGLVTNLLNPKAILYFLSIFSAVVPPTLPIWVRWSSLPVILVIEGVVFGSICLFAARLRPDQANGPATRWIGRISALCFLLLAGVLFAGALQGLL